jgi:hypothetical protein
LDQFLALVIRDANKIVHHAIGVLEDIGIDALMHVADLDSSLIIGGDVGLINVPDFAGSAWRRSP